MRYDEFFLKAYSLWLADPEQADFFEGMDVLF